MEQRNEKSPRIELKVLSFITCRDESFAMGRSKKPTLKRGGERTVFWLRLEIKETKNQ